jgi:DNA-binding IscR family transcriptional regulator
MWCVRWRPIWPWWSASTETSRCLLTSTCQLKGVLGAALEAFFASLDKVALSEVMGPSQRALLHVLKRMP